MVCFSGLVAFGVQLVPVGRSVVLGYTFPLWVAPAAWLLLGEKLPALRLAGLAMGLAGLGVMFNPAAFDWGNRSALLGNGMILLAALCLGGGRPLHAGASLDRRARCNCCSGIRRWPRWC